MAATGGEGEPRVELRIGWPIGVAARRERICDSLPGRSRHPCG